MIPAHACDREPNHAVFVNWTTSQRTAEPIQFAARLTPSCAVGDIRLRRVSRTGRGRPVRSVPAIRSEWRLLACISCGTTTFSNIFRSGALRLQPHRIRGQRNLNLQLDYVATAFDHPHGRAAPSGRQGSAPTLDLPETVGPASFVAGAGTRDNLCLGSLDGPNVRCHNTIRPDARSAGRINSSRLGT